MDLTALTGPAAALLVMGLGGRWLMQRLEKADEERKALVGEIKTLIADNTKAMTAMSECARALTTECRANTEAIVRLANGVGRHETDPAGLRVVHPPERNG